MKMRFLSFVSVLALCATSTLNATTHTWTGAAGDGKWSTAFNWAGSSAPVANAPASVILQFPPAGTKHTTNDISNLVIDQIQVSGDNYVIAAMGAGTNVTLRSQVFGTTFFISGNNTVFTNFVFNLSTQVVNNTTISISTGDSAYFRSHFTGQGGLEKFGGGTVRLAGSRPNSYSGTTFVHGGLLELSHSSNAIPANLVVGNPSLTTTGAVTLLWQHEISDSANVTVHPNGIMNFNVYQERIASLTMSNVTVTGGVGLTVSNLTSRGESFLSGVLQLGGAYRTLDVVDGKLSITGFIENNSGNVGFYKTGEGTLELVQNNGYNGGTVIQGGRVIAKQAGSLGTAAFNTEVEDGTLELGTGVVINQGKQLVLPTSFFDGPPALVLNHNSSWQGPVALGGWAIVEVPGSNTLGTINGTIASWGKIIKKGHGTLRLAGTEANTFAGGVDVLAGTLELAKPQGLDAIKYSLRIGNTPGSDPAAKVKWLNHHQLPDNVEVLVDNTGTMDLNNFSDTVGPMKLRGAKIQTGIGVLTLNGNVQTLPDPQYWVISTITGHLALNHPARVFTLVNSSVLSLQCSIMDGPIVSGMHIVGPSDLIMKGINNVYGGETRVTEAVLTLDGPNVKPGSALAGTVIENGAQLRVINASVAGEALSIEGSKSGYQSLGALYYEGTNTWTGPITLTGPTIFRGDADFFTATHSRLILTGPIVGPGSLTCMAFEEMGWTATVDFGGSLDNTFSGPLLIQSGGLVLNKTAGAQAVPCDLELGTTSAQKPANVRLAGHNQIANSATVTLRPNGTLSLNSFNEAVGSLKMQWGAVQTGGSGVLTLLGDLQTESFIKDGASKASTIEGRLSLGANQRNFNILSNSYALIYAEITDGGGLGSVRKTGGGGLWLANSNTYSGPTLLEQGSTWMLNPHAFGSTASGTVVSNGATLDITDGHMIIAEPLQLVGESTSYYTLYNAGTNNLWTGPVTLQGQARVWCSANNGSTLEFRSAITGAGNLVKVGGGKLILGGNSANTFTGETQVTDGILELKKTSGPAIPNRLTVSTFGEVKLLHPDQISNNAELHLTGTFDMNGKSDVIGSLEGGGRIKNMGDLGVGLNNLTTSFSGTVEGTGYLSKLGTGTFTLTGSNTYSGVTYIQGGRLDVDGQQAGSAVSLMGGVLGGRGVTGAVAGGGDYVAPGHAAGGDRFGCLKVSGLNLNGTSQARFDLGGTEPGVTHDQVHVTGGLFILNNVPLVLNPMAPGAVSNQYTIIRSDAGVAMGTFAGLPEGATVAAGGVQFRISYVGGDGNDVVLTQLTAALPAELDGITPLQNGQMQISGSGAPGASYSVEANSNLGTTNWVNLGTIQATQNGALTFIDTDAPSFQQRFYRFKAE